MTPATGFFLSSIVVGVVVAVTLALAWMVERYGQGKGGRTV